MIEYITSPSTEDKKPEDNFSRTYYLIHDFFRKTLPSFYLNDSYTSAILHKNLHREFEKLLANADKNNIETLNKALIIYKKLFIESKKYEKFRQCA